LSNLKYSPLHKLFIQTQGARFEVLEGTTAASKTTVGIVKFILRVLMDESDKAALLCGLDLGVVEKNIINSDLGILDVFRGYAQYYPKGHGGITSSHLVLSVNGITKIIYVIGYDTETRWRSVLGSQLSAVFIDEVNLAPANFMTQAFMRSDYIMATLNPDNPEKEVYKLYINRCRPIKTHESSVPKAIMEYLTEPSEEGWIYWFFTFDDNPGLTEEKKERIKASHTPGTADYLHYILGLRGKATGVVFSNFTRKKNTLKLSELSDYLREHDDDFALFSSGLDTSYSINSEDTIAMSFVGVTKKGRLIVLSEKVLTNKGRKDEPFTPSDICEAYEQFLSDNASTYGMPIGCFIDSADQATITEIKKYKRNHGSIFTYTGAYKKMKIVDRIKLQTSWIATGAFLVIDDCTEYISELNIYSWNEKKNNLEPEDGNDHMVNSVQYSFLPFVNKIGVLND